jgi:hypothetical protein
VPLQAGPGPMAWQVARSLGPLLGHFRQLEMRQHKFLFPPDLSRCAQYFAGAPMAWVADATRLNRSVDSADLKRLSVFQQFLDWRR